MPMMNFFTLKLFFNTIRVKASQIHFSTLTFTSMDKTYSAPDRCIKNILDFARSYKVENTSAAGKVELMLN
jgi:hypothetical protein